ncbi:unnamed protein product [Amoebophrya sp. A25]|nr:unnamed protein product [Amoebophrya sp. A25]|eukprot:GSA25T00004201001.1
MSRLSTYARIAPVFDEREATCQIEVQSAAPDAHWLSLEIPTVIPGGGGSSSSSYHGENDSQYGCESTASYRGLFNAEIFTPEAEQEEIFEEFTDYLDSLLSGVSGCIFAYGQTGTGKTYTVYGGSKYRERGLLPRLVCALFKKLREKRAARLRQDEQLSTAHSTSGGAAEHQGGGSASSREPGRGGNSTPSSTIPGRHGDYRYAVSVKGLEVYNDAGYDLLASAHQDSDGHGGALRLDRFQSQPDLAERLCETERDALDCVFLAALNRSDARTRTNANSSRSHAIFTVVLEQWEGDTYSNAKLHLVDLAGSERAHKSSSSSSGAVELKGESERKSEARAINKSLHFLEQVVIAIQQRSGRAFVPFRNSLMTFLLKDALLGHCRTSLIATLSPLLKNAQESLSTLRFAQRCSSVLLQNEPSPHLAVDYRQRAKTLEEENRRLAARVRMLETQVLSAQKVSRTTSGEDVRVDGEHEGHRWHVVDQEHFPSADDDHYGREHGSSAARNEGRDERDSRMQRAERSASPGDAQTARSSSVESSRVGGHSRRSSRASSSRGAKNHRSSRPRKAGCTSEEVTTAMVDLTAASESEDESEDEILHAQPGKVRDPSGSAGDTLTANSQRDTEERQEQGASSSTASASSSSADNRSAGVVIGRTSSVSTPGTLTPRLQTTLTYPMSARNSVVPPGVTARAALLTPRGASLYSGPQTPTAAAGAPAFGLNFSLMNQIINSAQQASVVQGGRSQSVPRPSTLSAASPPFASANSPAASTTIHALTLRHLGFAETGRRVDALLDERFSSVGTLISKVMAAYESETTAGNVEGQAQVGVVKSGGDDGRMEQGFAHAISTTGKNSGTDVAAATGDLKAGTQDAIWTEKTRSEGGKQCSEDRSTDDAGDGGASSSIREDAAARGASTPRGTTSSSRRYVRVSPSRAATAWIQSVMSRHGGESITNSTEELQQPCFGDNFKPKIPARAQRSFEVTEGDGAAEVSGTPRSEQLAVAEDQRALEVEQQQQHRSREDRFSQQFRRVAQQAPSTAGMASDIEDINVDKRDASLNDLDHSEVHQPFKTKSVLISSRAVHGARGQHALPSGVFRSTSSSPSKRHATSDLDAVYGPRGSNNIISPQTSSRRNSTRTNTRMVGPAVGGPTGGRTSRRNSACDLVQVDLTSPKRATSPDNFSIADERRFLDELHKHWYGSRTVSLGKEEQ